MDRYSDLDLFALASSCDLHAFLRLGVRDIMSQLGEILMFRGPVLVDGYGYSFTVLFSPSFVCQLNINTRDTLIPTPMQVDDHVLWDHTGFYTSFLMANQDLSVDNHEVFMSAYTYFWLRSLATCKDIQRGHLWLAIRHLSDVRDQLLIANRLLRHSPPPGLDFRLPSKKFETDLGTELAGSLGDTLPRYDADSIIDSLLFCIDRFLQDTEIYASAAGIDFEKEHWTAQSIAHSLHTILVPMRTRHDDDDND
ncbi:MAG: hypothetical protein ABFD54_12975 [Armatimonadota bacterium]